MRLQWLLCHKRSNDIANQHSEPGAYDYTNDCHSELRADIGSTDFRPNANSD
jgi:hypothetical protein